MNDLRQTIAALLDELSGCPDVVIHRAAVGERRTARQLRQRLATDGPEEKLPDDVLGFYRAVDGFQLRWSLKGAPPGPVGVIDIPPLRALARLGWRVEPRERGRSSGLLCGGRISGRVLGSGGLILDRLGWGGAAVLLPRRGRFARQVLLVDGPEMDTLSAEAQGPFSRYLRRVLCSRGLRSLRSAAWADAAGHAIDLSRPYRRDPNRLDEILDAAASDHARGAARAMTAARRAACWDAPPEMRAAARAAPPPP